MYMLAQVCDVLLLSVQLLQFCLQPADSITYRSTGVLLCQTCETCPAWPGRLRHCRAVQCTYWHRCDVAVCAAVSAGCAAVAAAWASAGCAVVCCCSWLCWHRFCDVAAGRAAPVIVRALAASTSTGRPSMPTMPGLTLAWPGLHCNVHAGTGVCDVAAVCAAVAAVCALAASRVLAASWASGLTQPTRHS
jgi:hypothetical protein